MNRVQEAVDPEVAEDPSIDHLSVGEAEKKSLNVQALAIHKFVRSEIESVPQRHLQEPEATLEKGRGGPIDQVILLASICIGNQISNQIILVGGRLTVEVLVENEADTQAVGVDAREQYCLRECSFESEMYWTPADPELCSRPGDLDELQEMNLIEKKSECKRNFYTWLSQRDQYRFSP